MSHDTTKLTPYPGGFNEQPGAEEMQQAYKSLWPGLVVTPQVKTTDTVDLFTIEATIPGVKKEEFRISAEANGLDVCVLHPKHTLTGQPKTVADKEGHICFNAHIALPDDADTEFACAEYVGDVLRVRISKVAKPHKGCHTHIAVY